MDRSSVCGENAIVDRVTMLVFSGRGVGAGVDVDVCLSCNHVEMRCTDKGWVRTTSRGK